MKRDLTPDRRILKAFYTQYVAVLLILLVFSVGIVARKSQPSNEGALVHTREPIEVQIGEIELKELFAHERSAQLKDGRELEAVLEILRNHDVKATLTVYATSQLNVSESFRLAVLRARALHAHVLAARVPVHAVRLLTAAAPASKAHAKVSFESMEGRDERS
jgi:hypothetical protein